MKITYTIASYILVLLVMGLYGYIKTGSTASIIMSSIFSAALAICLMRINKNRLKYLAIALLLITALMLFFAIRWWFTTNFFPAGFMTIFSAVYTLIMSFFLYRSIINTGDK